MKHHCQLSTVLILVCRVIAELHARRFALRVNGAPQLSKSTHPRKFGNHMTVHRPSERASARPHHRATNVYSPTFQLIWEPKRKLIAHQCCDQLTAVKTGYPLTISPDRIAGSLFDPSRLSIFLKLSADKLLVFK